ncbi:MAG: homoserine O-succinyltransferase, partial [Chromatiaceae bacterium]
PDDLLILGLDNTWRDTAHAVVGNWMGLVYQTTHRDPRKLFMDGVDPNDPLQLGRR